MTEWITDRIILFLIQKGVLVQDEDIYRYGTESTVYTILSTLGLLFFGCIAGMAVQAVICIVIFYLNQSIGGGYHANTHMRCFIVMLSGLLVGLAVTWYISNIRLLSVFCGLGLLVLFAFPLVLHPQLQFLAGKEWQLKKRSNICTCVQAVLFIVANFVMIPQITVPYFIAIILSAISRIAGRYVYKHRKITTTV